VKKYILIVVLLLFLIGITTADSLTGWQYRKEITLNNTGSELTNYQVKFTVNRDTGSDSGYTVYVGTKCEADYDDIRFTTSDGTTLLDYWIESSSSSTATIWVEVGTIAGSGDTYIYLYYGNAGASAVSNGTNTFPFFDDFLGSSLDTEKWYHVGSSGSTTVSDSIATIAGPSEQWCCKSIYSIPICWMSRYKVGLEDSSHNMYIGAIDFINGVAIGGVENGAYYVQESTKKWRTANPTHYDISRTESFTTTYKISEFALNGVNAQFIVDHGTPTVVTNNVPTYNQSYIIYNIHSGETVYVDWVIARNYTATEPTVSAWGSEEELIHLNISVYFSGVPTSGYTPLLVTFTDSSIEENATINSWQWSFGDSSANSTQQNPQHQYTTSGLYSVILTISNTSFSLSNSTIKTNYINVTSNPNLPVADFAATDICGDNPFTTYFVDFSSGSGLYDWQWSFGDGSANSTQRNPSHTYSSDGSFDVTLTVTGAYGTSTLKKEGYITVPCGAAPTPTPTPTATTTGTIPIQQPVESGKLSPFAFVVLAAIDAGLYLYTFIDNENRNYYYIYTAIACAILSFLLSMFLLNGFITESFVVTASETTVNTSVYSTHMVNHIPITDVSFAYVFALIGVIMIVITILASIEALREISEGY
jgi:PKD repeat protein